MSNSAFLEEVYADHIATPGLLHHRVDSYGLQLASCGSDGPGTISVDPGKFTFYHCDDLARRWTDLIKREDELRGLIEKANESAAGTVIGSVAYRSD
jgi:hypothetical protein